MDWSYFISVQRRNLVILTRELILKYIFTETSIYLHIGIANGMDLVSVVMVLDLTFEWYYPKGYRITHAVVKLSEKGKKNNHEEM